MTHAPPHSHCDYSASGRSKGCEALRRALWRVRPLLSVCGHTHEGRGVERVRWKLDLPFCPYLEEKTKFWDDPGAGTNKLSLVDLTRKGGKELDNYYDSKYQVDATSNRVSFSPPPTPIESSPRKLRRQALSRSRSKRRSSSRSRSRSKPRGVNSHIATAQVTHPAGEEQSDEPDRWHSRLDALHISALSGRLDKKETCIVNAAITGTSWGQGPKKFNKPIVIDIDLPVWEGAKAMDDTMSPGIS